jgi:hypothetical protein
MTHRTTHIALIALAISLSSISTFSYAYTSEDQQMCSGDAMRLCWSEIPDVSRIAACMHHNRAKLSVGCRAVMDGHRHYPRRPTRAAID